MEKLYLPLIRPPRLNYDPLSLGPLVFTLDKLYYYREDLKLICPHGYTLECSYFESSTKSDKCIIYLHGNSSSRLEGLNIIEHVLPKNINVFLFDFPGCGLSEGDFVSVGYFETQDLQKIVHFLKKEKKIKKIGLWGRSMGGVVSLLFKTKMDDNIIRCIVADSPFSNLKQVCRELVRAKFKILDLFFEFAWRLIKEKILGLMKFDVDHLNVINNVKISKVPLRLVCSREDEIISYQHSLEILKEYAGQNKELIWVKGGHNDDRDIDTMEKLGEFLADILNKY